MDNNTQFTLLSTHFFSSPTSARACSSLRNQEYHSDYIFRFPLTKPRVRALVFPPSRQITSPKPTTITVRTSYNNVSTRPGPTGCLSSPLTHTLFIEAITCSKFQTIAPPRLHQELPGLRLSSTSFICELCSYQQYNLAEGRALYGALRMCWRCGGRQDTHLFGS